MNNKYLYKPRKCNFSDKKVCFGNNVAINACDDYVYSLAKRISMKSAVKQDIVCGEINTHMGIPQDIIDKVGDCYCTNDEGYAVVIGENIEIYGESRSAIIFALSTIEQLIDNDGLYEGFLYDYPDCSFRAHKVFIPGEKNIESFKKVVNMLVYYKYNTIMIEVGGAMEYKRRPEINEAWVKHCKQFIGKSGETFRIQHELYPWQKNCTHVDNGDGGYISQDIMRELVKYCKDCGLDVIPEMPTLSHSDYIVNAYPHINERVEDEYPDTYCPSNPESYEIVFDIIDEIVEVFEPKYINIGHDELYTVAVCDKCKDKSPVDLFVNDIIKINDYIKGKNAKTLMWCEKMFKAYDFDGKPAGGSASLDGYVPALYECAGKIPKDILMINWYWSRCDITFDEMLLNMGYNMVYGNFQAFRLDNYRKRINNGIKGGFISNWGSMEEEYMQRNIQNFSLVYCSLAFWSSEYDNNLKNEFLHITERELYRRHCGSLGDNIIEAIHKTDMKIEYKPFYDGLFIEDEKYVIGNYVVNYTDGTIALLPIKYGCNISNCEQKLCSELPAIEPIGAAKYVEIDNETYYMAAYKNPYPDKEIKDITLNVIKDCNIELHSLIF